ncbi:SIMPL domain-containing protein [soil metagenome]
MRLLYAGIFAISTPVLAQDAAIIPSLQPPSLNVGARGEIRVAPDRATVHVAVETRAENAAAAASQNATVQQRVIAAIRALGVPNDRISTTQYNVLPDYRYEPNREARLVGYRVTNTVVVELHQLDRVGPVLDASLGAGANMITGLQFYASNTENARRDAIGRAIQTARGDAEAMARAAGGSLGQLLEAHVGAYYAPPPPMPRMMEAQVAGVADTPINPGQQTVAVDVQTRWRFHPPQ